MINIDNLISVLAPQQCIACGVEGFVLCQDCLVSAGETIPSRCVGCHTATKDYKTCNSCKRWLPAYSVRVATSYEGIYEELLRNFKFNSKRDAVQPIAEIMTQSLGSISDDLIVCSVPTAPSRIRQRGFDHARMLSRKLAELTDLEHRDLLGRNSNVRQLGSTRSKRIEQMKQEFYMKRKNIKGKNILLVDDVTTTGASLSAASRALKDAGAKKVYGVVFAQKL